MRKYRTIIFSVTSIILILVGLYFLFPGTIYKILLKIERSSSGLTENSINVNGLNIHYLEGGTGETILLVHGFTGDKDNWTRFAKHITPDYRLIAIDIPGFGNSSKVPGGDYTISSQVKRLKSFAEELNLESFHLGGGSMGGYIASVYAATYPENIKSLLLVAPLGVNSAAPSQFDQDLIDGKSNIFFVSKLSEYDVLLDNLFVERPFIPRPLKIGLAEVAIKSEPLYRMIFDQIYRPDDVPKLEEVLSHFTPRTQIIWGTKDLILDVSGAEILGAAVQGSNIEIMEDMGHNPMIEDPEETAVRYLEFLNSKR
jgi:pimeloyl-ACP methyl ester carboxylesterase